MKETPQEESPAFSPSARLSLLSIHSKTLQQRSERNKLYNHTKKIRFIVSGAWRVFSFEEEARKMFIAVRRGFSLYSAKWRILRRPFNVISAVK